MPSDMTTFLALGGDGEYQVQRTETMIAASHHASPEDLLRKFGNISRELQVLSGKKAQKVEEAKKQFEKESEERARRDSEDESLRRGSDAKKKKKKDSLRFATHTGAEEDQEAKLMQAAARPSLLRAATTQLDPSDAGGSDDKKSEKKASQSVGGMGGDPGGISASGLSEMEERFLQACDPQGLSLKVITLAGEDTESALLTGYQRILAYFRHKSMLADLGDHFDRMRHAAMMGEEGAIHELATANTGGGSPTAKAQQRAGQSKPQGKKKGHVRLPDDRGDHSGDDKQEAKKSGKAKLPALGAGQNSNAHEAPPHHAVARSSLANQAMHQNQALHKAGLGHIARRSQMLHSEGGLPVGPRKSLTLRSQRSQLSLVDQSPYQSEGAPEPLPPPTAPGPAGPRKSRAVAVGHRKSERG